MRAGRSQRFSRDLMTLVSVSIVVAIVCSFAVRSASGAKEPSTTTPEERASARPVVASSPALQMERAATAPSETYDAKIETFGWRDVERRVLDLRIDSARLLEVDAVSEAERVGRQQATASPTTERLVNQRVLAVVDPLAAEKVRERGRQRVRLVVVPNGKTVQLTIRGIWSSSGTKAAASGPIAISLSRYSGKPGTEVTINGTGFGPQSSRSWVTMAGIRATATSWSNSRVVFTVPKGAKRGGYVGVVVDGDVSNGLYFVPFPTPKLDSLSPKEGAPGTIVELTGSEFGTTRGDGWVSFGGTVGQVVSWSDQKIRVVVPQDVGACFVGVVRHGLSSNGRLFAPYGYPVVQSVSPRRVIVGGTLTITGRNFGAASANAMIGGVIYPVASWSSTKVTLVVPPDAKSGYVGIRRSAGMTTNGLWVTVSPRLTSLSRWWAEPGSELTVRGQGFGPSRGSFQVTVGKRPAEVLSWSANEIRLRVPETAPTGYVGVGTPAGCSNGRYLLVETKPRIDSVSRRTVRAGDLIVINGANFDEHGPKSRVIIGWDQECSVVSWTDTCITAVVPAGVHSGYLGVVEQRVVSSNGVWLTAMP